MASSSSSPLSVSASDDDENQSKILFLAFNYPYEDLENVDQIKYLQKLGPVISRSNGKPEKELCVVNLRIKVQPKYVASVDRMISSQNRLLESSILYEKIKDVKYI